MADPFTIEIYVPDGEPQGIRIIGSMNWTGLGIAFPRDKWPDARKRHEFDLTGVYILYGLSGDDDLPTIYVGEGDGVRDRIQSHYDRKDFWSDAVAFVSANRLNKAHVQWLEFALIKQALLINQCRLQNGNHPQEPALTESEKADTNGFLRNIYQILPLLSLRVFEKPRVVAAPKTQPIETIHSDAPDSKSDFDTLVVPGKSPGFEEAFLGEHCWYPVRIAAGRLPKIRWIAGYQGGDIGAITYLAPVDRIEPYGDKGQYKLYFSEPAKPIRPIQAAGTPGSPMQSIRYTTRSKLLRSSTLRELFDL